MSTDLHNMFHYERGVINQKGKAYTTLLRNGNQLTDRNIVKLSTMWRIVLFLWAGKYSRDK